MTPSLRHAARSTGLTAADTRAAESALGRGHGLSRALANQHSLALQVLVAGLAVVVAVLGVLLHLGRAPLVAAAAALVAVAFAVAWAVTRSIVRERVQDLIAAGDDRVVLSVVSRERRRLASRKERERLARSLERLQRDALRWHEILPHFRPPHGVVQLRNVSGEVTALTAALRHDRVRVQGVALTARFLTDGYRSPLYANELGPLRDELDRIRYLLECTDIDAYDESRARRRAA